MSLRKIKFGNKEVNKKVFYSSKQAISLDSVDLIIGQFYYLIKHIISSTLITL